MWTFSRKKLSATKDKQKGDLNTELYSDVGNKSSFY